jgi:MATE family multidrug resistance protein
MIEVSLRRVFAIALPMMLAHVTTPLLGVVGTTAVGRLGDPALLGGIAIGAVVFDFLFWTFGALRMATAGLTAQSAGAGRHDEIADHAARGLTLALVAGVVLVALQGPIGLAAFRMAGASPEVTAALALYFGVRIWAAPFTLANYVVLGSVLGRGRTDIGLVLQMAINATNVALTLLLVGRYGVGGAAMASLVAEALGAVLGFAALVHLGSNPLRAQPGAVFDRAAMLRMLAVNRDIMIRTLALVLAYAVFTSAGARSGDVVLAANAILQNLWLLAGYVLDGFATAAETLCGQAIGARDERLFRRSVRLALACCFGFGLALTALSWAGGDAFIDLVTTSPAVREEARRFLVFAALMPFVSAAAFTFDGVFIGATWNVAMRNLMLVSFTAYLGLVWAAAPLGNGGLWLAMLIFLGIRGLGQALAYPGLVRRTFARADAPPRPLTA